MTGTIDLAPHPSGASLPVLCLLVVTAAITGAVAGAVGEAWGIWRAW